MGFAELSIASLAEEYGVTVPEVYALCDRLEIAYKDRQTCLALEDAKVVILELMARAADRARQ